MAYDISITLIGLLGSFNDLLQPPLYLGSISIRIYIYTTNNQGPIGYCSLGFLLANIVKNPVA